MVVGIGMLAQWSFLLASGSVPELRTEPLAIGFHLVAEAEGALSPQPHPHRESDCTIVPRSTSPAGQVRVDVVGGCP